ncbi:MAG: PPC domain-containing protein, partial [Magnetococcus sp. WYHC-3]
MADRYEENDSLQTAASLGQVTARVAAADLSIDAGDDDWFSFTLGATPGALAAVRMDFNHAQGDLDFQLLNSQMTVLAGSYGVGNSEQISLSSLVAGTTYYLRVYGYRGVANPQYALTLDPGGSQSGTLTDQFEGNVDAMHAASLGLLSAGSHFYGNLNIASQGSDWFAFGLGGRGTRDSEVRLDFTSAQGELDFALYDGQGNLVERQDATGDGESLSLEGIGPGVYFLQVYGYQGASNPNYSLTIQAPQHTVSADDAMEPNDTAVTAHALGTVTGFVEFENLVLLGGDDDWYRFNLATVPTAARSFLVMTFDGELGDLDLDLYDTSGTLVASRHTHQDWEALSLAGLSGQYLVRVSGYQGASNPDYALHFSSTGVIPDMDDDDLEENDTRETATDFRLLGEGEHYWGDLSIMSGDADWYRFELAGRGTADSEVRINFIGFLGDVDMALYDAQGGLLASSTGVGDSELIHLEGRDAGTYFLRVYGYSNAENPLYSLTIEAPRGAVSTDDRYEDNDSAATARDLGTLTALGEWENLVILSQDADWYRFTLPQTAGSQGFVRIDFDGSLGDLDLRLYNTDATPVTLGSSSGVGNWEQVSLNGLAAGSYLVQVYGYGSAANPEYHLSISPDGSIGAIAADDYEDNDTRETAAELRDLEPGINIIRDLSVEANDADWYRMELGGRGTAESGVRVDFSDALGDVDMALYDAQGTRLTASTGTGDSEGIGLEGRAAGTYYLQVYGFNGATNPNYTLSVRLPEEAASTDDRYEDNDTATTAYALGTLTAETSLTDLVVMAGDADWYSFTLSSTGAAQSFVGIDFDGLAVTHAVGAAHLLALGIVQGHVQVAPGMVEGQFHRRP